MSSKCFLKLGANHPQHIFIMDVGEYITEFKDHIREKGVHPEDYFGEHGTPEDCIMELFGELIPDERHSHKERVQLRVGENPKITFCEKIKPVILDFVAQNKQVRIDTIEKVDLYYDSLLVLCFGIK